MLPGRESLIRLVGKRRRRSFSPHLSRLLLRPQSPPDAPPAEEGDVERQRQVYAKEGNDSRDDVDWVSCPVCGSSVRGTNYNVNNHLDLCLTRGTKRKLTQRTLLQFKFSPHSKIQRSLDDLDQNEENVADTEPFDEDKSRNRLVSCRYNTAESTGQNSSTSGPSDHPNNFQYILDVCNDGLLSEAPLAGVNVADNGKMSVITIDSSETGDADSRVALETFIVGRRFYDDVELQQGAKITILRDSQNAKDKHAIKVLSAGSERLQMLGYLPRELAKYLAPLLDSGYIECEGFVSALPKRPLDVVPIQLNCKKTLNGEMSFDDQQRFESLLKNTLVAVEDGKMHPPSSTRYQKNFLLMIEDVLNSHAHLFTEEEKSLLATFSSLSDDSQRLFIRLYTRKGPWFRISSISYPEISDPLVAIEELQVAGFVYSLSYSNEPFCYEMKEVLHLLPVSEMREILVAELPKEGINISRRQELINILSSAYEEGKCPVLPKLVLKRIGTCVRISTAADEVLWRVLRLFFLNGEQDLSAFLLVDLGLVKFPDYVCRVSHQIFRDRRDLLEYEEAIHVAQTMDESLDDNNMEIVARCINVSENQIRTIIEETPLNSDSPPAFFSCFSASWVYSKVLTLGVSVYERERRYEDAIGLLKGLLSRITSDSGRGYWTLRLSVDLEHMGRLNESLLVAEEGVLDKWVRAGSKMALQRRVLRLCKPPRRWKTPNYAESIKRIIKEVNIMGRPLICEVGAKNVFYGYDGKLCGVEQLALQYYAEEGGGWRGIHSESGIWMTIFGLLMWDVLFADIPDVFRSKFQVAPLDLDTDDFYEVRKSLIETQLKRIHEGMAEEILISSWELHHGTSCRGVRWDSHSPSDLRAAVSCIGGRCLASLCRHLALDYRNWSSGMPDLLLWRFHGDNTNKTGGGGGGGEAKLVEVKGPRDQLSEQQRAWMLLLMDCGFDAEVCKVSPAPKDQ
ncbi:fanconi-associated nuclease 1 homolog isoform X1 [Ananas comosus]|uniref:Fanconi-associated nuclease n=2 Tax=Ananas comosus TaxID=4615 RepID=A0A6P5GT59_ANACO|nr:fanconi-associated nuclease 1 homolog isoform X1 [Ananas comosus]